jgi:hypothetical protein
MRHLLRVEDTFQVTGRGLVVVPDILLPNRFANFSASITVIPPDSEPFQAKADFFLTHFNPGGFKLLITCRGHFPWRSTNAMKASLLGVRLETAGS